MAARRTLLDSVAAGVAAVLVISLAVGAPAATASATVPRPDHVVVVVLENHSAQQVIGASTAPYINSLAASGALMTQSYALTHPSQPNYIALFSGSTQGVTDDSCPFTFAGPNFGSALIASGNSFIGYSEDLPSAGYTGCVSGNYARKHNPWVNFSDVPAASNQSLSAFPTDYNQLPTVSYVIPNLQNDMHDGTIAQSDSWLQSKLGGYVTWARTHNSLLLLTFDEDDYHAANQIPTIFVGSGVVPGNYPETITHYNVLRTLEDAYGLAPLGGSATATPITDIWGTAGPVAPVAFFTSAVSGLSVSVDGSGSSAAVGSVASYAWTFGDGTTATGATASHSYTAAGTYTVSLTVTDAVGTTGTTTRQVTVTAPTTTLAWDSFSRTVAAGFGTADIGGAWSAPATAAYSVSGTQGVMRIAAGGGPAAYLPAVSSVDTDFQIATVTDKPATGSGLYLSYVGRRVVGIGDYRVKVRLGAAGDVSLVPERVNSAGVETTLGAQLVVPGLKYNVGDQLQTRLQVTGTNPTTLRAKVWKVGGTEPAAWAVTATDSTAGLQAKGSIGVADYLSSTATNAPIAISYDNLVATPTTTVVNSPPTAAFTSAVTNLSVAVDGSGSTDPAGSIVGWSWSFGDGATGSGATANHAYAVAGTYTVSLTVTDNGGATATITRPVTVTAPVNQAPIASFTANTNALTVSVDGSGSTDPNGTVVGWSWSYGDGATGSGATASHTYAAAGTYTVTLNVTDNGGATASNAQAVTVVAAPNQSPVASFTTAVSNLSVSVDGSSSSDPDGSVTSWAWAFGDGATATGATASHSYASTGTYTVSLTVTDNSAGTTTTTQQVSVVAPANQPPLAAFTAAVTLLSVAVDGTTATDPDGSVVSWAWTFGDGATGIGSTATHVYAVAGTYTVSLTVTDNGGATATTTRSVTTTAPANQPPLASFTAAVSNLSVAVDGSASSDADGSVSAWTWAFGDGTTATGSTATHAYAAAATYTVSLTVTDNGGATATTTRSVTTAAPATGLASDSFTRAVASGWGTADLGGPWTLSGASAYSASGTAGVVRVAAGAGPSAMLNSVSSSGTDLQVTVATDKPATGSGLYVSVVGRKVAAAGDYRVKMWFSGNGSVSLVLERVTTAGAETTLGPQTVVSGLSYAVGDQIRVRLQVTGINSTTLRAKAWKTTAAEPANWLVSATDSTAALQVKGGVGLVNYLSSTATNAPIAVSYDNLVAVPTP